MSAETVCFHSKKRLVFAFCFHADGHKDFPVATDAPEHGIVCLQVTTTPVPIDEHALSVMGDTVSQRYTYDT